VQSKCTNNNHKCLGTVSENSVTTETLPQLNSMYFVISWT